MTNCVLGLWLVATTCFALGGFFGILSTLHSSETFSSPEGNSP